MLVPWLFHNISFEICYQIIYILVCVKDLCWEFMLANVVQSYKNILMIKLVAIIYPI